MIAVIKWFQEHKWLSSLALFAVLGIPSLVLDVFFQSWQGLIPSVLISAALVLARSFPWYAISLVALGGLVEISLFLKPVVGGLMVNLVVFILAMNASVIIRRSALLTGIFVGLAVIFAASFYSPLLSEIYGIAIYNDAGRWNVFLIGSAFVAALNFSFFTLGRLAATQLTHVGTAADRQAVFERSKRVELEFAEQTELLGIARDLTDLVVQDLSAVLSIAEGGKYAARVDETAAVRSLERIYESSQSAHQDVRRLYDLLNRNFAIAAATPNIDSLESLAVDLRELGYNVLLRHDGERFVLGSGAELAIYRIVFEALENIKKNVVRGADVSVEFSWVNDGLQVLIKDNGIETVNRAKALPGEAGPQYTVEDDLAALTDTIAGAGIAAMRARASLYGGSVEASRVPGVGFTVSAIFPMLRTLGNSEAL